MDQALPAQACHRLIIPNQISAIRQMSAWLESAVRELGGDDQVVFKFDLCANEAVTNVISYAYDDDAVHEIALQVWLAQGMLTLEIDDDGRPFNPLERPNHLPVHSLDEAIIGGLGIDLMRKFMDNCGYAREDSRNRLSMALRLVPTA